MRERILVVDDHAISREYTTAALRQTGCTVKQAAGVREALELVRDWRPRLVVVDWNLGDGTAEQLLHHVHHDRALRSRRPEFVLLTGEAGTLPRAQAGGFQAVLRKPCSVAELQALAGGSAADATEANGAVSGGLRRLFRAELERELPLLGGCLLGKNLVGAQGIAHRLIAGSAICGEAELERSLRGLQDSIAGEPQPDSVADAWCRVSRAAREIRAGGAAPG